MELRNNIEKRVVLISWKKKANIPIEVFSNLKNLCLSYPQFNYNTMNNYLGKSKTAYENSEVKIERKVIYTKPLQPVPIQKRSILPIVVKAQMKNFNEKQNDLEYWLTRPAIERITAVTSIISQSLKKGERMDKSYVHKQKRIR